MSMLRNWNVDKLFLFIIARNTLVVVGFKNLKIGWKKNRFFYRILILYCTATKRGGPNTEPYGTPAERAQSKMRELGTWGKTALGSVTKVGNKMRMEVGDGKFTCSGGRREPTGWMRKDIQQPVREDKGNSRAQGLHRQAKTIKCEPFFFLWAQKHAWL